MATVDRALGILRLFAEDQSEWTVEAAARELGLAQSTAYQYFRSLVDGGLLSTYGTGRYVVGPAIIELDRQARRRDPLILSARADMDTLATHFDNGDDVVLLCRLYKLTVMCIDERAPLSPRQLVSYERGRPMPLERGAASKVILAYLTPRVLRRYHRQVHGKAQTPTWAEFRQPLRAIRRARVCVTHGELDAGRIGISAPIFAADSEVVGSIGLVLSEERYAAGIPTEIIELIRAAGDTVSLMLQRAELA